MPDLDFDGVRQPIPIRILMASGFGIMLLCFIPLFFAREFKRFIGFNPATDSVESLMA